MFLTKSKKLSTFVPEDPLCLSSYFGFAYPEHFLWNLKVVHTSIVRDEMKNNRCHILTQIIYNRGLSAVPVVLDANGVDADKFVVNVWYRHFWKVYKTSLS